MQRLKKLLSNFGQGALMSLGPRLYALYLIEFLLHLPVIFRTHDLRPIDKIMGAKIKAFNFQGKHFYFDCQYCDNYIKDGSFAFGLVREIYFRNCYFKFHMPDIFKSARVVLDLGANRGTFSTLMATRATRVISVEAQAQFVPVIQHNMSINRFENYAIECGFIGANGKLTKSDSEVLTIEAILARHQLKRIDLIKIDIEGSEFGLFESTEWLDYTDSISMEVHPDYGNPRSLLDTLAQNGFEYTMADANLSRLNDPAGVAYVYAHKRAPNTYTPSSSKEIC